MVRLLFSYFNTLELNISFYRFPTLKSLQGWYNKAPKGFDFSAKVPRSITHFRKMEDTERMLNDFYELLKDGLKEKLGCVLFQFPPQFTFSEERLEKILKQANPLFNNVIEFRHDTWWRKDVQETLKKNNISFCGVSFPKIQDDNAVINTSLAYYRFHGCQNFFIQNMMKLFYRRLLHRSKKAKK